MIRINSVAKKEMVSSGSRGAAPSKVTNYYCIDRFGVVDQPHRCTGMSGPHL